MLVISGLTRAAARVSSRLVSISQSRCLSFQVEFNRFPVVPVITVSISQSRCLSFQGIPNRFSEFRFLFVSISQSRCLSFQESVAVAMAQHLHVSISQSRCLSFQGRERPCHRETGRCFNLAIEMLVISGRHNRKSDESTDTFQSRNRDACHFRQHYRRHESAAPFRFNLAIEMLVISGDAAEQTFCQRHDYVSISQSRCLSFQGRCEDTMPRTVIRFQSRNRDACHFRNCEQFCQCGRYPEVSISQSRCLSFQDRRAGRCWMPCFRFNLAIEMLVISGRSQHVEAAAASEFQSRNRDACHFRTLKVLDTAPDAVMFQSRNRDACHFRRGQSLVTYTLAHAFQSRNRDACHFRQCLHHPLQSAAT